ncbi:NAD(P)-dependent oxidoreductase [Rhodopila sp.]|jgi:3-hydroxyisobutyrate dehydrogenase|uniref:NAD(P)-dependent oxidoreductase n=1 Tax=Rhodopila sp. TaxID=2480087 RepID=UPI002B66341C|nr:NAD(P)-dependent oxidoreductase [Rhodopila sp.]HVZ09921.1 NAD(P)-dependent oxidoreductase [Rhodopila sp.]
MKAGFIGLGTMGASMAANLQKGIQKDGHTVVVHDVRREAASRHLKDGAVWADSPAAIAESCDVIFSSLPGPAEFDAITYGEKGLLSTIRPGVAFFDLTTNSPSTVRKAHGDFQKKGAYLFDAPVSGGPRGAATGKLAIWCGGDADVFEKWKPVLDTIGDQARYIGPIGAGSVAKLVHNCYGYIATAAAAEVFSMGVKAGIEPLAIWEAVRQGAIGRRGAFDSLTDQFLPNKYEPPAFALRLAHKDVSLATQLGRELNVPMRLANLALADLSEGLNRGWGNRDSRAIMLLQTERAGVEVKVDPQRLTEALENKAKHG